MSTYLGTYFAVVRFLAGVNAFVNRQGRPLYELLAAALMIAYVRTQTRVNPLWVKCQCMWNRADCHLDGTCPTVPGKIAAPGKYFGASLARKCLLRVRGRLTLRGHLMHAHGMDGAHGPYHIRKGRQRHLP